MLASVAPGISLSPRFHWYVSGADPVATTENTTCAPTATVWLWGCVVITGGLANVSTASDTNSLRTDPAALLTTTL